jgi:hypothetical protein
MTGRARFAVSRSGITGAVAGVARLILSILPMPRLRRRMIWRGMWLWRVFTFATLMDRWCQVLRGS